MRPSEDAHRNWRRVARDLGMRPAEAQEYRDLEIKLDQLAEDYDERPSHRVAIEREYRRTHARYDALMNRVKARKAHARPRYVAAA